MLLHDWKFHNFCHFRISKESVKSTSEDCTIKRQDYSDNKDTYTIFFCNVWYFLLIKTLFFQLFNFLFIFLTFLITLQHEMFRYVCFYVIPCFNWKEYKCGSYQSIDFRISISIAIKILMLIYSFFCSNWKINSITTYFLHCFVLITKEYKFIREM